MSTQVSSGRSFGVVNTGTATGGKGFLLVAAAFDDVPVKVEVWSVSRQSWEDRGNRGFFLAKDNGNQLNVTDLNNDTTKARIQIQEGYDGHGVVELFVNPNMGLPTVN